MISLPSTPNVRASATSLNIPIHMPSNKYEAGAESSSSAPLD